MTAANTVRKDGFVEFAMLEGETAWHGNGNHVPHNSPVPVWIEKAGMDWELKKTRVRFPIGMNNLSGAMEYGTMDDKIVLLRSDTRKGLAIVSDSYKVVQPREVMEFFTDLVENAGFKLNTAGTLFDGRKFWASARVEQDAPIMNSADKVGGFLLLSTSCDGTMETEARWTTTRVVCNNTLQMARGAKAAVKVSHRSEFKPDAVKDALGIERRLWAEFMTEARAMAKRPVSTIDRQAFTAQVCGLMPEEFTNEKRVEEVHDMQAFKRIMQLSYDGRGARLEGVQGTVWGMLNAATEFVDHFRKASSPEQRFFNAQWGLGEDLKEKAREVALSMI